MADDNQEVTEPKDETLYDKLSKPFPPNCVEWVILNAKDIQDGNDFWVYAIASPYIQKESAEDRADQVFGSNNWENDFTMPDEHGRFVYWIEYEWNGKTTIKKAGGSVDMDAEGGFNDSDFEIALSYAEKRAWQKVGIGRYLKLVKAKKVVTKLDFEAGWERYSFKSKWQKKKQGKPKYIQFYWKTPSLPNKALPEKFRNKQDRDGTDRPQRKTTKAATEDQWEEMESYIEHAPESEAEAIREAVYNEIVDEEGDQPTGEVTYERKNLAYKSLEKMLGKMVKRYGKLTDDGVPAKFVGKDEKQEEPDPDPEDNTEPQSPDDDNKEDGNEESDGEQEDMFDGKKNAKNTYEPPARGEK
jgi:hypothetical protein